MIALLLISAATAYFVYYQLYGRRKGLPPGPTPLPIFGNIFQLDFGGVHKDMLKWKKEYGSIFTVWLPEPNIVVNDYEALKEYFVKQGDVFAGRHKTNMMDDFIGGMYGLIISDNKWYKSQRRYSLHVLRDFGLGRPILQDTIIDQSKRMIQLLEEKHGVPLDIAPYFTTAVGNIIFQLVFGYTRDHTDTELHTFKDNLELLLELSTSTIGFLVERSKIFKLLDPLFGNLYKRAMVKNEEVLDYLRKEIAEHKRTVDYESEPRDYIDAYLQEIRKRERDGNIEEFTDHQLLAAVYDLFGAGLETTATTSRTFLLYMIHYPEVQRKIQDELDRVIGRDNPISMTDLPRLPYLNAAIQELQRIAILVPVNFQREILADVKMGPYEFKKGTIFIPQFPSVHLDEKVFPDPEKLIPERHIDANGAFKKDDRIMPFSVGKRSCLGESLARMELFLFLSHLLQKFEFLPEAPGKMPAMEFKLGFIRAPKQFLCRVVSRK